MRTRTASTAFVAKRMVNFLLDERSPSSVRRSPDNKKAARSYNQRRLVYKLWRPDRRIKRMPHATAFYVASVLCVAGFLRVCSEQSSVSDGTGSWMQLG